MSSNDSAHMATSTSAPHYLFMTGLTHNVQIGHLKEILSHYLQPVGKDTKKEQVEEGEEVNNIDIKINDTFTQTTNQASSSSSFSSSSSSSSSSSPLSLNYATVCIPSTLSVSDVLDHLDGSWLDGMKVHLKIYEPHDEVTYLQQLSTETSFAAATTKKHERYQLADRETFTHPDATRSSSYSQAHHYKQSQFAQSTPLPSSYFSSSSSSFSSSFYGPMRHTMQSKRDYRRDGYAPYPSHPKYLSKREVERNKNRQWRETERDRLTQVAREQRQRDQTYQTRRHSSPRRSRSRSHSHSRSRNRSRSHSPAATVDRSTRRSSSPVRSPERSKSHSHSRSRSTSKPTSN